MDFELFFAINQLSCIAGATILVVYDHPWFAVMLLVMAISGMVNVEGRAK